MNHHSSILTEQGLTQDSFSWSESTPVTERTEERVKIVGERSDSTVPHKAKIVTHSKKTPPQADGVCLALLLSPAQELVSRLFGQLIQQFLVTATPASNALHKQGTQTCVTMSLLAWSLLACSER